MSQRFGVHFVCRDDRGVTVLANGQFESRAWRVAEKTARAAQYIALHQGQGERSYRQGKVIAYRRDTKKPGRYVFVCVLEDLSLAWPGPTHGGSTMVINRPKL